MLLFWGTDSLTRRRSVIQFRTIYYLHAFNLEQEHATRMRNRWILLLAGMLMTMSFFAPAVSQQQIRPSTDGFISIDCGGVGGTDPNTTLDWVTDEAFLHSAKQLIDEGVAVRAIAHLDEAKVKYRVNPQRSTTAMTFVPGRTSRSKYCYNLTVSYKEFSNSTNYLVRATFPSSNLTAAAADVPLSVYGTRFYFTVDSTFITTVDLDPVESQTIELVVTSVDETIYICLVPLEDRSSMPAISSLELRPLAPRLYSRWGSDESNTASETRLQTTYLIKVARLNFGADQQIRFPLDSYDRVWEPTQIPEALVGDIKVSGLKSADEVPATNRSADIDTPAQVLATAWEGVNNSSSISFTFNITKARADRPVPTFYLTLLLFDVNPSQGNRDERFVNIFLQHTGAAYNSTREKWIRDAVITSSEPQVCYNFKQVFPSDSATFYIEKSSSSILPAMVNAVEVYGEFDAITERTAVSDATSIKEFANDFVDQVDTAGDPCLAVSWNWLVCNIEIPPRITQINLTNKGVTGELDTNFGLLNRLTVLDLSDNSFHGQLPSTLVEVVTLRSLNIANNDLSGELPPFRQKSLENLESLSLQNNKLSGSLLSLVQALADPVSSLDLSSNLFTGSIPVEIGELRNLRNLNLSHNQLSGTLQTELVKLPGLKNLHLQNNTLGGLVPDDIWSSKSSLVHLDLQGNRFTELNLTTWGQRVLEKKSFDEHQQKVSLVGNEIRNVILPLPQEGFELVYQSSSIPSPAGFILLGGNPWCNGLEVNASATLIERYLCRVDERTDFWSPQILEKRAVSARWLAVIIVACALVVLFLASVLAFLLWRTWKRMKELRQIQEALAKDDVRPPFFKYEALKAATKDFAQQNELGKGAFGAVYKAVLGDGSIVAVKRLFPTQQNVTDFLKEMVLITGIKHRHLVQLKGCCVRDKQRMLVYEYAENKNLAEALWACSRPYDLTWAQRFNICVGIARGLAYLHEELQPKIIHRDIKPQNILLDKDLNPKIADFGLARPIAVDNDATQMSSHIGGTLGYFSPEYATMGRFTEKLDVYSYGVLVLEIVSGRRCIDFSLPEEEVYLRNWAFSLYKKDKLLNMAEKSLLAANPRDEILSVLRTALACLQEDPNERPSMSQVVHMLVAKSDLAVDIIKELKDHRLLFDDLFDVTVNKEMDSQQEKEVRCLLSSTYSTGPLIELSGMKAR